MIVITGAAGFIGSCLVAGLNEAGYKDLVVVDEFTNDSKNQNLEGKTFSHQVPRKEFISWLDDNHSLIQFIFHLGARTDTTEHDKSIFDELNVDYSKAVWNKCIEYGLPLVYASSAATYGSGEQGYKDDHKIIANLKPLNPYGTSKQEFDLWVLEQDRTPFFWAGLKFFNVYGPNEYHKGRMASVIFHTFNQVNKTGEMKLFASNDPNYEDGMQLRDFIYVKDLVAVCIWMMEERKESGIFNLGTGKARTFYDLAKATQVSMDREPKISFIPMPEDLVNTYQNFTEADMQKLIDSGYDKGFHSLEEGIDDYVRNYLVPAKYY